MIRDVGLSCRLDFSLQHFLFAQPHPALSTLACVCLVAFAKCIPTTSVLFHESSDAQKLQLSRCAACVLSSKSNHLTSVTFSRPLRFELQTLAPRRQRSVFAAVSLRLMPFIDRLSGLTLLSCWEFDLKAFVLGVRLNEPF